MGIIQELQCELQAKHNMLESFQKDEHYKREARGEGHFPKWKEEKGKERFASKNGNKKLCTHCWNIQPKKEPKGGKVSTRR